METISATKSDAAKSNKEGRCLDHGFFTLK
jgi:hypothetical protein